MAACSTVDEAAANVFASRTQATALHAGQVLQGQASFTAARAGTVQLQSATTPPLSCFGAIRYTATSSGVATLSCSDGAAVAVPFDAVGPLRGAGRVQLGAGVFSLTYGLPPDMVAAYLGVPLAQVQPLLP